MKYDEKHIHIFHIPGPTACVSPFAPFSVFLTIFQFLYCEFQFFFVFKFYRQLPGPTVCISHFPPFSMCLAIFQVLQCVRLIFQHKEYVFFPCSISYNMTFSFSFRPVFLPYIRSYMYIFYFSRFSVFLALFQVIQCLCLIFHVFQFSCHISCHIM